VSFQQGKDPAGPLKSGILINKLSTKLKKVTEKKVKGDGFKKKKKGAS